MSEPTVVSLMAEVLKEHRLGIREWSDGYRHTSCMCPEEVGSVDHDRHVAELLASRLNLHEERRIARITDGHVGLAIPIESTTPSVETLLRTYRNSFIQSRLVSDWAEEQQ